jgi:8-hydroxy-5-deazaflavin:NADPH oxidoreductase
MSIAIIGAGNVGMALARALIAGGETVVFGVPDPAKYRSAVAGLGAAASVGAPAAAISAAELVILAVPYAAAAGVAAAIPDWGGKILVDATNPIAPGLAGLSLGTTTSGAEQIALAAKGARVVKAFNTTGAENMANSRYQGGRVLMPVCGDDAAARTRVLALASLIGLDAVDCGALQAARYLEPFAMLWIHLAYRMGHGRSFAFAGVGG